jgi:hypothetical protein
MTYELRKNKYGTFFIKNHKYYYLDQFDIWGLDRTIWFDKIDYISYKVKFINKDNKEYINIRKI